MSALGVTNTGFYLLSCLVWFWVLGIRSCVSQTGLQLDVAKDDLKLLILPPQPSESWDYSYAPPCPVCVGYGTEGFVHAGEALC